MSHSFAAINRLPQAEKERVYARLLPPAIFRKYSLDPETLTDSAGRKLARFVCPEGSPAVEISLKHDPDFEDPIFFGHFTDTMNGQIQVLLLVVNDPDSPRFNVDRMPGGAPTKFGILERNLAEEARALEAGLAPGQVRRGPGLLREAEASFAAFVTELGQSQYFVEPLFYHNAITFERYGFSYQKGKRLMETIHRRFSSDPQLLSKLDGSSPFRRPGAEKTIRGRSWATHDGILDGPYTGVQMYKTIARHAGISTFPNAVW